MITHWQRFIDDRTYFKDVTRKTLVYYACAWNAWGKFLPNEPSAITPTTLRTIVIELRRSGLCAISTNTYLRALNTFLRFLDLDLKAPLQVVPQTVRTLFTAEQILKILHAPPQSARERRIALAVAVVIDTGLRASEALGLRVRDVDTEHSTLLVRQGKGRKDRVVPISRFLRQRVSSAVRGRDPDEWLLSTCRGTQLSYRNSLRDLVLLCKRLGVSGPRISWHTLRHSFASNYIKTRGDVSMLSRILGHTTLTMTMKYVHLQTEDLVRVHNEHTMLG